jgi:hypothetical protein
MTAAGDRALGAVHDAAACTPSTGVDDAATVFGLPCGDTSGSPRRTTRARPAVVVGDQLGHGGGRIRPPRPPTDTDACRGTLAARPARSPSARPPPPLTYAPGRAGRSFPTPKRRRRVAVIRQEPYGHGATEPARYAGRPHDAASGADCRARIGMEHRRSACEGSRMEPCPGRDGGALLVVERRRCSCPGYVLHLVWGAGFASPEHANAGRRVGRGQPRAMPNGSRMLGTARWCIRCMNAEGDGRTRGELGGPPPRSFTAPWPARGQGSGLRAAKGADARSAPATPRRRIQDFRASSQDGPTQGRPATVDPGTEGKARRGSTCPHGLRLGEPEQRSKEAPRPRPAKAHGNRRRQTVPRPSPILG